MKDSRDSKDQQLMVALRVRPISVAELEEGATLIAHKVDEQMVVLMDPMEDPDDILRAHRSREKSYLFDVAFDFTATQEMVYQATTKSLIEGVISGYNATVFAYGPTGCGKTYTMLGTDREPGIYVRTLNDLFRAIEETSNDMEYEVSMSYLEVSPPLTPASARELREDSKGVIQVAGITEVSTINAKEIMQLLMKGNRQRTQEPTAANQTSSRSHAVLQVAVRQRSRVKNVLQEVRQGRLFMIDLAGSERASQTQNRGQRMKEGAHINRSLLALGNCINALSDKNSNKYINYRDSKLTRLLKDSLGGNSRTVMIAHISPASSAFEESRNTLTYAGRAKNIKTRVKQNLLNVSYHIAQYTSIIADLRGEIQRLKCKIDEQGGRGQARGRPERGDIRHIQGVCWEPSSGSPRGGEGGAGVRRCWVQIQTRAFSGWAPWATHSTALSLPSLPPEVTREFTPLPSYPNPSLAQPESEPRPGAFFSSTCPYPGCEGQGWLSEVSQVAPDALPRDQAIRQSLVTLCCHLVQDQVFRLPSPASTFPPQDSSLPRIAPAGTALTPESDPESVKTLSSEVQRPQNSILPPLSTESEANRVFKASPRAWHVKSSSVPTPPPIQIGGLVTQEVSTDLSSRINSSPDSSENLSEIPLSYKGVPPASLSLAPLKLWCYPFCKESPTLQHAASEDNLSSSTGEAPSQAVGPVGEGPRPWMRGQKKSPGKRREESLEAKKRKRRSRSFEVTGQGLSRPKTHLLGPRPTESISDHRVPVCGHPAPGIRHLGKVTLPLAKVKLPPSQSTGPGDPSPLAVPSNPAGISRRAARGPRLPHGASTHGKDVRFRHT
uniref:Kinesin-like protein n=1 Tax=Panthera tigris altaica TaxID=74533 RepID=A0A8C9K1M3_PANTA